MSITKTSLKSKIKDDIEIFIESSKIESFYGKVPPMATDLIDTSTKKNVNKSEFVVNVPTTVTTRTCTICEGKGKKNTGSYDLVDMWKEELISKGYPRIISSAQYNGCSSQQKKFFKPEIITCKECNGSGKI